MENVNETMYQANGYEKKEKKEKPKKPNIFKRIIRAISPKNAMNTIRDYGFDITPAKMLGYYLFGVAIAIIYSIAIKMNVAAGLVTVLCVLPFVPSFVIGSFRAKYEKKKFNEANTYMDTFLYAFLEKRKLIPTLQDVLVLTKTNSKLYSLLERAINKALGASLSEEKIIENALSEIEEYYDTYKISTMHSFAMQVENTGGNYKSSVEFLIADRGAWHTRTNLHQAEKKQRKTNTYISLGLVAFICCFFIRIISSALPEFDISHEPIVLVADVIFFLAMLLIARKTDKKLTTSWFDTTSNKRDVKEAVKRYEKVSNWDEQKEKKKSIKWAIGTAIVATVVTLLCVVSPLPIGIGIAMYGLAFLMLFQHKMSYSLAYNDVKEEMTLAFPRWLMEVSLRLQTENVQTALYNSFNTAPEILKPELEKFYSELRAKPNSVEPYINFLSDYEIDGISSAMKILSSISFGTGGNADEQITDIIRRNSTMLEVSEKKMCDNELARLRMLFMSPTLITMVKLMLDCICFLVYAMNSLSTISA